MKRKSATKQEHLKERIDAEIAASLYQAIDASTLTVGKIAERAGISKGYLDELKRGSKRLNVEVLYRLALALEIPPAALLPASWREGATFGLDTELLSQAISIALKVQTRHKTTKELPYRTLAAIIEILYQSALKNKESLSEEEADRLFKLVGISA